MEEQNNFSRVKAQFHIVFAAVTVWKPMVYLCPLFPIPPMIITTKSYRFYAYALL